jgi:hypothetical protein
MKDCLTKINADGVVPWEASSTSYNRPVGSVKAADHPISWADTQYKPQERKCASCPARQKRMNTMSQA